jgi:phosphoribosylpyrophosphate synthetase
MDSKQKECRKLTVLSVGPLLAEAITRIHEESSLSSLFV